MERILLILAIAFGCLPLPACVAQQTGETDDSWVWMDDSEAYAETGGPFEPLHGGPRFRWFGRVAAGGNYKSDEHLFNNETDNVSFDFEETVTVERFFGSVELMWQAFLGDPASGTLETGNWRLGVDLPGVAFDAGRLPTAGPLPSGLTRSPGEGWFDGYRHAYYAAFGLATLGVVNRMEDDFRSPMVGNFYQETEVVQSAFGTQVALGKVSSRGRWLFDLSGRLFLGAAVADFEQRFGEGSGSANAAAGGALVAGADATTQSETDIFARGELRFASSYFFSEHWSLDLQARAFLLGPWYEATRHAAYESGDLILREATADSYYAAYLTVGMTYLR